MTQRKLIYDKDFTPTEGMVFVPGYVYIPVGKSLSKGETMAVLAYCIYDQHHNREPSILEIIEYSKMSLKTIYASISKLEKRGHLVRIKPLKIEGYTKEIIPDDLRWEIFERDNFTCQICGVRRRLTVDHIQPERFGGTLDKNNLRTLCRSCNSSKGCK